MAERPAWPAVLAGRWRSRPGVVRVAAVLLGLFGLLLVLIDADEGPLELAVVVTALLLVSAAAALVWAGRLGYWIGLAVAALVALLLLVALTRRPGVAGAVVTPSVPCRWCCCWCRRAGLDRRPGRDRPGRPWSGCGRGRDRWLAGGSSCSCWSSAGC
jgi:hypothetical protein